MNKIIFILLISFVFVNVSFAASNLSYVKVEKGVLYFETKEIKTHTSPSCVLLDANNQWAVSLNSPEGQHIKTILFTAVAGNMNVEVKSANDCRDALGIERAKSVALVAISTQQ